MHRTLDLIFGLVGAMVLVPVSFLVAPFYFFCGGHIIFKTVRLGEKNKPFVMYKFRTMVVKTPVCASADLRHPDQYLLPFGKFLRKFSIDELPQCINVLLGDMSWIGPRPALPSQRQLVELRASSGLCDIKPGITGYAQISGRDELSDLEKVRIELRHLEPVSVVDYLRLIGRTCLAVVMASSVSH
jgi:O-antigen biosynthesis protein WbqP